MIGSIIGDIAGSRFEYNNTRDYDFDIFSKSSDYTDDTICSVAIADAILKGKEYGDSLRWWCQRYPRPMGGYGTMFNKWLYEHGKRATNSYGNGAAMRVGAVGWAYDDVIKMLENARKSASCSHDHIEAKIGASAVALCIYGIRMKDDLLAPESIASYYYSEDWEAIIPKRGTWDGTCQGCVSLSFKILLEAKDFEDAIRKSVVYGGDSDTIGAIVGSMAEAYFGIPRVMAEHAMTFLPDEMRAIVEKFEATYGNNII